ncbi:MAG: alpha-amylase [Promethearchaeota archaeon]|nr:MAG: alpha-amylase [Candidatus Lokiarchaeota archaeon]
MKERNNIWKDHPNLYEINTLPWLTELSETYNEEIKLGNIPDEIFQKYIKNFDAVWLMGVWERSPASKRIAQELPDLQKEYKKAIEHVKEEEIIGSPYAIYYYHVDKDLGGREALIRFRERLNEDNIKLVLDYVPNHVARDHMWTLEKSDMFIEGTWEDMNNNPDTYFSSYGRILAHGKDPYFPAWTDTVQINAFSSEARDKAVHTINSISEICDGVRCDMAMLVTNEVLKRTWGDKVGNQPEKDFWEEIIPRVKDENPNFKFIAEVYWDMEWRLMQHGFDYCYDKKLYDIVVHGKVGDLREYLHADFNYQKTLVRFIENHDEKRAVKALGILKSKAAAILALTLPGMGLIHEGQMKGYEIRIPVQLKRRMNEMVKNNMLEFYRSLLTIIKDNDIKKNNWELCNVTQTTQEDQSNKYLISYHWWNAQEHYLFIINFSENFSKGKIKIPTLNLTSGKLKFKNLFTDEISKYAASDIQDNGFKVELASWKYNIFRINS